MVGWAAQHGTGTGTALHCTAEPPATGQRQARVVWPLAAVVRPADETCMNGGRGGGAQPALAEEAEADPARTHPSPLPPAPALSPLHQLHVASGTVRYNAAGQRTDEGDGCPACACPPRAADSAWQADIGWKRGGGGKPGW